MEAATLPCGPLACIILAVVAFANNDVGTEDVAGLGFCGLGAACCACCAVCPGAEDAKVLDLLC